MFPGMNPKKMQAAMKQMGISQEEVEASRVIIEKPDNSKIIIEPAQVTKVNMQGQDTWQIMGNVREESGEVEISKEDIKQVVEKTGVSEEKARTTLEETGDLAEAIISLSS